jgi:hypothetical protein
LAYNFTDDPIAPPGEDPQRLSASPAAESPGAPEPAAESPGPVASDPPPSTGFARFASCRWQQPEEDGNAAFCTHREVKPYAGTAGFDADAWCPECQYYKLRRAPKKRTPSDDYSY